MQHLKWALMLKKVPVHCCASCIGSLIYFGYLPTKKKAKKRANSQQNGENCKRKKKMHG